MVNKKLSRDERFEFIEKFFGRAFTVEEVVQHLKGQGVTIDEKQAVINAWNNKARQFLHSFKDADGVRILVAFNSAPPGQPRKMSYHAIETCADPEILRLQIQGMTKNRDGQEKLIEKAKERLAQVDTKLDLFDLLELLGDAEQEVDTK